MACVILVSWVVTWSTAKELPTQSPRAERRQQRRGFLLSLPVLAGLVYFAVRDGHHMLAAVAIGLGVFGAARLLSLETLERERDARTNYALDPTHCGRCEYSLTGIPTNTCPECGWHLPERPVQIQHATWHVWWRRWRIEYLVDPRQELRRTVIWAGALAVAAVAGVVLRVWAIPVLCGGVCVHLLINLWRIRTYLRSTAAPAA